MHGLRSRVPKTPPSHRPVDPDSVPSIRLLAFKHEPRNERPRGEVRVQSDPTLQSCIVPAFHRRRGTVENDLNARQTQRANCIEVAPAAAQSVLNLKGHQVIGKNNGTGTGILIRQGADHVVIQGASQAVQFHPDDDPCAPTGSQAIVTKWDIGIEDDHHSGDHH